MKKQFAWWRKIWVCSILSGSILASCEMRGTAGENGTRTSAPREAAAAQPETSSAVDASAAAAQPETSSAVDTSAAVTQSETSSAVDASAAAVTEAGSHESLPEKQGDTSAERREWKDPVVTRHRQEGLHMVTAGKLTISVPTTFEGLEQEGACFLGEGEPVKPNATGSCRVSYRGQYGNIRIDVINNTEYTMAVRDCTIKGVEIASREPDPELTLYGIPMGATRQQVADVYGEPFSKTFDDAQHMSNMVYQFGDDIYSSRVVMILFENGRAVSASYDDFSQVAR